MDFAKLVEVFDRNNVTFVSVTQSFNTTTSMGRLTLNILLSFAQFEREVIGERIRDKFAASRRKGMWMGGWAPLGYDIKDRKLIVNEPEAKLVRSIFTRFARGIPPRQLIEALAKEGALNKQGKPIDKGYLYRVLNNRVYLGEAVHKGTAHPGEHDAIIERDLWDQVHALISESPQKARSPPNGPHASHAERPDLRPNRCGHDAGPYPKERKALPLLRLNGRQSGMGLAPARSGACRPHRSRRS